MATEAKSVEWNANVEDIGDVIDVDLAAGWEIFTIFRQPVNNIQGTAEFYRIILQK